MRVLMIGLSHRTAPLPLRERVAIAPGALAALLDRLRAECDRIEAVALSTCNRTELYIARPTHQPPDADRLRRILAEHSGVAVEAIASATVHREQDRAALHLFRVCAGLDSMVLGEPQVLGQVKRAYEAAARHGSVGAVLHRLFQDAIAAGKKARSESGLGEGRVSIGTVAMDFARQVFDRFEDKAVLAIGAGEMMKATLRCFDQAARPRKLWVVNRSIERAAELMRTLGADLDRGGPRSMQELEGLLIEADVVIACTGATEPILTGPGMKTLVRRRRRRPLLILDLGLPRDVDAAVASLANVYLYNLDDLQSVIQTSTDSRLDQVEACDRRLAEAVGRCMMAIQHRDVGQLVRQLRHRLMTLGEQETRRTLRKLAPASHDPAAARDALQEHTRRLINKILHVPLSQISARDTEAPLGFYAAALRRLFDLEEAMDLPDEDEHSPPDAD